MEKATTPWARTSHHSPQEGELQIAQGRELGDVLEWEPLRACLTEKKCRLGILFN